MEMWRMMGEIGKLRVWVSGTWVALERKMGEETLDLDTANLDDYSDLLDVLSDETKLSKETVEEQLIKLLKLYKY